MFPLRIADQGRFRDIVCEGERALWRRYSRAVTKTQSLHNPQQFSKSLLGKGPWASREDPPQDSRCLHQPRAHGRYSCSLPAVGGWEHHSGSAQFLGSRRLLLWCSLAGWGLPCTHQGFPAATTALGPWRPRSFFPSLPPTSSCLYRFPPSFPPPPPPPPTIRFIKSPFVSQEAGEREGERDSEAEGGGGSLQVASSRSGQED